MGSVRRRSIAGQVLGFDDLVEAFLEQRENEGAVVEWSRYTSKRLAVLATCLGCTFRRDQTRGFARTSADVGSVMDLAVSVLDRYAEVHGPFLHYLEGTPGPLELALRKQHKRPLDEALSVAERIRERLEALRKRTR